LSDILRASWCKLGIRFGTEPYPEDVDPEKLIVETTYAGRNETRLLWAMLTWIVQFADLLNSARLVRMLPEADIAVLGAVLSIAIKNNADKKLNNIIKKCKPKPEPEILFHSMAAMNVTAQHEKDNALDDFKAWGLFSSTIRLMDDAIETSKTVLQRNKNLAFRAAFGPSIRSDLLFWLSQHAHTSIRAAAQAINLSYQPVYAEALRLTRNGLVACERIGHVNVLSLTEKSRLFLAALPV